jgi:cell wall-associated NlpC family hydrolase
MIRIISSVWLFCFILALFANGCASQIKEMKGISRVGYSIQVGAFAEVKNAERLTSRLQRKGIDAFYFRKENGFYAVRFGDYTSREAARRGAGKLVSEKIIGAYFIASPQDIYLRVKEPAHYGKGSLPRQNSGREMGGIAARTAERFVGIPYQWGGDNVVEGMDCSGFVRAVYNLCGVNIPRTSREQFRTGENVGREYLKDGDLVFFGRSDESINHVGIYVGNGRFVHAPRRGDEIKVSSLEDAYFSKKFIGAKRYF